MPTYRDHFQNCHQRGSGSCGGGGYSSVGVPDGTESAGLKWRNGIRIGPPWLGQRIVIIASGGGSTSAVTAHGHGHKQCGHVTVIV